MEGEKTVTRYILEQTRRNGDDLAAVKTRLGRVEQRLDGFGERLDRVESRVGGVERQIVDLRKELPGIVGDAVREAFRERDQS